jgi:hypothetical protein
MTISYPIKSQSHLYCYYSLNYYSLNYYFLNYLHLMIYHFILYSIPILFYSLLLLLAFISASYSIIFIVHITIIAILIML